MLRRICLRKRLIYLTLYSARITIADIQKEQGQKYAEDLQHQGYQYVSVFINITIQQHHVFIFQTSCLIHDSVTFVCTDVTSWESQVKAFKAAIAHSQSGESIDIVVAGAGLRGNAFKNSSEEPPSLEKDPKQPTTDTIDVNLTGLFFTAKLAHYYFRIPSNSPQASPDSKALILMGSVAGYLEVPFVADYNATKWAVRGIFRSIREPLAQKGIRVNMIAPWVMDTPMSTWLVGKCKEQGLLVGNPDSVTEAIIRCAADDSISGEEFFPS